MNVVAIIQARMGSSRLPGKVVADLGGRTMLERVLRRTGRSRLVDRVVVATSKSDGDERIVQECRRLEVDWFRGPEDDVLKRYCQTAQAYGADVVVRITADCPFIDPTVTDRMIRAFLHARPDYASNTLVRTWPRGLDTEVISEAALERACCEAGQPYERVHVTPYLYRHPEHFRLLAVRSPHDLGSLRWTVDSLADLTFAREIYRRLDNDDAFSWRRVRRLLTQSPSLADLNRHVRQKALVEG
jgi:spore coat polysaccharide biosynthesis protein SpsF